MAEGSLDTLEAELNAAKEERLALAVYIAQLEAENAELRTLNAALSHARAEKEAELRDAADGWYQGNVRWV
jgi:chromosome segregation ATPase